MFKVDKDIPPPTEPAPRGRPAIYPWEDMDIGDSFLVGYHGERQGKVCNRLQAAIRKRVLWYPTDAYDARRLPDGIRIWRTA